MKALIIHPKNKKQGNALKCLFKAFEIRFEEVESPYDRKFIEMIRQGEKDLVAGKGVKIDIDKLFVEKI